MSALSIPVPARLELFAAEAGLHGVSESAIPVRLGISPSAVQEVGARAGTLVRVGDRWFAAAVLDAARTRLLELVRAHHARHPLDTGAPRQEILSRLGADASVFDHLVTALVRDRQLEVAGAELRLAGRAPELSEPQRKITDEILKTLETAGQEPPSVSELQERFGTQTASLLRHLERQQRVVQVEDNRYYTPEAVRELLRRLESGMSGRGELAPADLREVLGFSRKYLIPFLEYCDRRGYTSRQGSGRIWRGAKGG